MQGWVNAKLGVLFIFSIVQLLPQEEHVNCMPGSAGPGPRRAIEMQVINYADVVMISMTVRARKWGGGLLAAYIHLIQGV